MLNIICCLRCRPSSFIDVFGGNVLTLSFILRTSMTQWLEIAIDLSVGIEPHSTEALM